jgi:hypothetical protein
VVSRCETVILHPSAFILAGIFAEADEFRMKKLPASA